MVGVSIGVRRLPSGPRGECVTERATRRKGTPEAAVDGSRSSAAFRGLLRGGRLGLAVLLIGLAAAALMVAAELSTYREIQVVTASCEELTRSTPEVARDCITTGGEQHNYALVLVALVTVLMAWGAGPGRSRPAAGALAFLGLVVLAIALVGDLPNTDVTGAVGRNFDQAKGVAGPAVTLEILASLLALGAGALRLRVRLGSER